MMHYNELVPAQPALVPHADRLRLAVAAYLARFKGTSRDHADSDLRCYLTWCADRSLDPFVARRPHLELYIRWMQEVRRFKPSTVSRRFSVTAGFYRTCVIDGVLGHSPAVWSPAQPPGPHRKGDLFPVCRYDCQVDPAMWPTVPECSRPLSSRHQNRRGGQAPGSGRRAASGRDRH